MEQVARKGALSSRQSRSRAVVMVVMSRKCVPSGRGVGACSPGGTDATATHSTGHGDDDGSAFHSGCCRCHVAPGRSRLLASCGCVWAPAVSPGSCSLSSISIPCHCFTASLLPRWTCLGRAFGLRVAERGNVSFVPIAKDASSSVTCRRRCRRCVSAVRCESSSRDLHASKARPPQELRCCNARPEVD